MTPRVIGIVNDNVLSHASKECVVAYNYEVMNVGGRCNKPIDRRQCNTTSLIESR